MFFSVPAVSYGSESQQPFVHAAIEDLGNGFYGITTLEIQTSTTRATKTASKTYTLKNSSGSTAASFTLTATFRYPSGNSALCTYVSHDSSISDSQWSFSEKCSSKSGNTAQGNFTAKQKYSGITAQTISKSITLTCDRSGNIS